MWRKVGEHVLLVANSDTMYEHVQRLIPKLLNVEYYEQGTASLVLVRRVEGKDTTSRRAQK